MSIHPIITTGILHNEGSSWSISLEKSEPIYDEGMQVSIVLWDARDPNDRSEVERIAAMQQLTTDVIAVALSAEGAYHSSMRP